MVCRLVLSALVGPLVFAQTAQTPPTAPTCFTISVQVSLRSGDGHHSEEHQFQETYRPARMGDIGIYTAQGTQPSCNIAAMEEGDKRRFFLTDVRGSATGREQGDSGASRLDGLTPQDKDGYVTITRKEKGATLEFSTSSPVPASDACAHCFGATAVTNFQPNVFELSEDDLKNFSSVTKTVMLTAQKDEYGYTGSGKATLNATLTPPEEEMIFDVSEEYDNWIPAPMPDRLPGIRVTPAATRLRVTVKIEPKKQGGEVRRDTIRFQLQEVTRHSGRTGNYPVKGGEKDDLRFAEKQPDGIVLDGVTGAHTSEEVTEATVEIEAEDTAAWGQLTARAEKLDLKAIHKPTNTYALTIPRDDDRNRIADAWERSMQLPPQPNTQADEDKVDGQTRKGDGMTVMDEYRGLVVLVEGTKTLRRFNPLAKEMFILDPAGLFDPALWQQMTRIEAFKVDESMIAGGGDEVASRVVNVNSSSEGQSKYAVRLTKMAASADPGQDARMGFTDCGYCRSADDCDKCKSPKDARVCNVIPERARTTVDRLYMDLMKAVSDPSSEEAQGMAAAGIPPFLAQRALETLRDPNARAAMAQKLIAQVVVHEVGHALSLVDHALDPPKGTQQTVRACPMYYPGKKAYWRFTVLQMLFKADAQMAMQYSAFCQGLEAYEASGYDCFKRLNVADW